MQEDLDLETVLQEITFDVYNEDRFIRSLSAHHASSFTDLHTIICEHIHLHPKAFYRFYIPKIQVSVRSLPRSNDTSSDEQILSYLSVGDFIYYQNQNHQLRLKVRSIGKEIDKVNMAREMRKAFIMLEKTVNKHTYLKKNKIQLENLELLYGLGSDLIQKQVHHILHDQSLLIFNFKGNNLLSYCMVSYTRDHIEYFFFPDQKELNRYQLVRQNSYLSAMHKEKYKHGMAMVLSKKPLREHEMSKPFNSQMMVEHACYLYFYDVKRGYEVDMVNNTQAKELMRYLVVLKKALIKMQAFKLDVTDGNTAMYIGYNPHTKTVLLQGGPKPVPILLEPPYENSNNITKLLQFPRTIAILELDYFFLPPENERKYKDERMNYLVEGICIGKEIRKHRSEAYVNEERIDQMMVDLLLDAMEGMDALPQKVYVRERAVFNQIYSFCQQLGIVIEIYARLPHVDAFYQSCMKR